MGLLCWLFGSSSAPAGDLFWMGDGSYDFEIVGESHYQDALSKICGGSCEAGHDFACTAHLLPEPSNRFDPNAVAVHINSRKVGYLSRDVARAYNAAARKQGVGSRAVSCEAMIVGGWDRGARGKGHFGVKLDLSWPPMLA